MNKTFRHIKLITFWILSLILILLNQSCEEDIEVFSGGQSVPIVYCLLNPSDTVHFVRVSKTYMIERHTNGITSEADSLEYPGKIRITLERWIGDELIDTHTLNKISGIEKDNGNFPGVENDLYRYIGKIYTENKYILYLYFEDREVFTYAEAKTVGKLRVIDPFPVTERKITLNNEMDYTIRWDYAPMAWIYQTSVRFNYIEIIGSDTINKSFNWNQNISQPSFVESDYISTRLDGSEFYKEMLKNITVIPGVKRKAIDLSFLFGYGGIELRLYTESIKPSFGILQEKPGFTNFNNCEGVFSSRSFKEINSVQLSKIFIDSISGGELTKHLGFIDSRDSLNI